MQSSELGTGKVELSYEDEIYFYEGVMKRQGTIRKKFIRKIKLDAMP